MILVGQEAAYRSSGLKMFLLGYQLRQERDCMGWKFRSTGRLLYDAEKEERR